MLNEFEMLRYLNVDHALSAQGKAYVRAVRGSEPSRMVGTHARANLVSWRVSSLTNRSVSLESRSAETAFFILSEYDSKVLELWDQPEPVKIRRHDRHGKARTQTYTPDFLALTRDGPVVVEVKTATRVEELVDQYPMDWVRVANGNIGYLPAERAFADIGIRFQVFVYSTEMGFRVANTELILQTRTQQEVSLEIHEKAERALSERMVWTLQDLRLELGLQQFTELIQLIDSGALHANLSAALLSEPDGFLVAKSAQLLDEGRALLDAQKVFVEANSSRVRTSRVPTTRDAERVLQRLDALDRGVSSRSVRRWKRLVEEGKRQGLSRFQSLLPRYYQSGNRSRRISRVADDYLHEYLVGTHADSAGISRYRSYIRYRVLSAEAHPGVDPVSQRTFDRALNMLPARLVAGRRGGKRAANAAADPVDPLHRGLRAQLPWERAAIDHYLADIYLVVFSRDGTLYVERPWITVMIDLATEYVLASTLSFLSPSPRAVSKVFRECVRIHGQAPAEIIVDRGAEFRSTFFASLLAHYGVVYTLRPASAPRFGAQVERLFGEYKSLWLSQRPANLADYKEARAVDGSHAPKSRAVLYPAQAFEELNSFFSWRNSKQRGASLYGISDGFRRGQELYPFIGRRISYDQEFMMMTAVDTREYKLDPVRGLHIADEWFYSPALAAAKGKRSAIQVRIDPENPHVVYALVQCEWVPCFSTRVATYVAKPGYKQLAEGLVRLEGARLKRKIRLLDDEALSRVIRSYDADLGTSVPEAPSATVNAEVGEPSLDLESLLADSLEDLSTSSWEDSYE